MRNNETGEFELVLGNRQLISFIFMVLILFGVFFAMGYIVGRNSAPSPRLQAEAALPNVPDTRQPAAGAPVPAPAPQASAGETKPPEEGGPPADTGTQPATQPAREAEPARPAAPAAQAPAAVTEPPAEGTYLQVMAVRQSEAEVVQRTLRDKNFPATLGPGPNGLVRVLVGPYRDTASLGKAKAELENAGFHPIVKK